MKNRPPIFLVQLGTEGRPLKNCLNGERVKRGGAGGVAQGKHRALRPSFAHDQQKRIAAL